jgi:hypothetical protein
MNRRYFSDSEGRFSVEIEVDGTVFGDAIDHDLAEQVLKCANIMALCALAQDGPWPRALLERMAGFMSDMKAVLERQSVM